MDIYEGSYIDFQKRMGSYCGNLSQIQPVIKSSGNEMTVNFISDETNHFEGFKALVIIFKNVLKMFL